MSQLLRFEGASPEEARDKARAAVGPDALIVRAGRQRSGGLLGFFEKELYVIEVDPVPTPSCPRPAPAPAGSLDAVIDAVEDAFVANGSGPAGAAPGSRGVPTLPVGSATARRARPPDAPPLSAAAERAAGTAPHADFSALLEEAAAAVAAARPLAVPEGLGLKDAPDRRRDAPAREARPVPVPALRAERFEDPRRETLVGLGLLPRLLPAWDGPLDTGLVEALRALPPAPPLPCSRDAVVVVAGPPQHVGPAALSIARRLGAGDDGIVAVPGRIRHLPPSGVAITYARDAAAAVADRRIAQRPCVVAVELRGSGPLPYLVAQVATAVRADQAWAVVPARWSRAQVRELDAALRGIAALCLVDLDGAEQPAALLGAGWRIATIDKRPATPTMWAARLLDRCEELDGTARHAAGAGLVPAMTPAPVQCCGGCAEGPHAGSLAELAR